MPTKPQQFGKRSEALAAKHLKKNGYKILCKNYRTKLGEIDLIAKDRDTLVFIEVKARRTMHYGHPKWSVTPQKQRKISMTALHYLKASRLHDVKARFDVVTICYDGRHPEFEIVKNAFELAYES